MSKSYNNSRVSSLTEDEERQLDFISNAIIDIILANLNWLNLLKNRESNMVQPVEREKS
jgi:hypothetical protein